MFFELLESFCYILDKINLLCLLQFEQAPLTVKYVCYRLSKPLTVKSIVTGWASSSLLHVYRQWSWYCASKCRASSNPNWLVYVWHKVSSAHQQYTQCSVIQQESACMEPILSQWLASVISQWLVYIISLWLVTIISLVSIITEAE